MRGFLLGFIQELRGILKRRWPELRRKFPDRRSPCHTCAFNPSTDSWKGFDSTAIALMRAFANNEPFYCHEPFERTKDGWKFDPDKAVLCAGYAAVVGDPATKTAFVRSIAGPDVPEDVVATLNCLIHERIGKMP